MTSSGDQPAFLPVRMVNEVVYCPRLFYLEWVDRRFVDNDDTIEGRYHHRRIDEGGDRREGSRTVLRSVALASERLGITGRVDVVEIEPDGRAIPVEYKRGRAADLPDGEVRLPERVQVCCHALLLGEAGYRCDEGAVWFAGDRRRVAVPIDDELVATTLEAIEKAREVAGRDVPPPPLVDDSRCPRCSLVGICLPDETNLLRAGDRPVRRLVPTASAARPLYVTRPDARVRKRGRTFEIVAGGEVLERVRIVDVSQIVLLGPATVTPGALGAAFGREVPVAWFTMGGWFRGAAWGLPSGHVDLRRRQVALAASDRMGIAKDIVRSKIRNQRTILRRNARPRPVDDIAELARLARRAEHAERVESLLGLEGSAARLYFRNVPRLLRGQSDWVRFDWQRRTRRPPTDPVNALLSFLYALLVKDLTVSAWLVGMDPFLGFFHRPRFGRPALALDLAEEFRPLVADSVAFSMINSGEIRRNHFVVRLGSAALTDTGRKKVLVGYERRLDTTVTHPLFGYKVTYRRLFELQARLLAAYVMGEVDRYVPFETR